MAKGASWIVRILDDPDNAELQAKTASEIEAFLKNYPVSPVID